MRTGKVLAALAAGLALAGHKADAQSFDCAQARTAVEKTICASPALRDMDAVLARSYQAVLALDPARAADATRVQRQWLAERDRTCAPRPGAPASGTQPPSPQAPGAQASGTQAQGAQAQGSQPPGPPADPAVTACLDRQYRGRLSALDAEAARLLSASLPAVVNEPAARLSRDAVAPGGPTDVLLQVSSPGRFAVRAESATGTALQLVDMIEGPGEIAGDAGVRDGRLDVLLDVGTYKVRTLRDPKATGESKLAVLPFRDAEAPSRALLNGGELSTALSDLEQRSFWIAVRQPGRVSIEAAGRALGDLRLWKNGRDLSELKPRLRTVEPKSGRPLTSARLEGTVEPGVYLATTYGRAPLPWTDGSLDSPLHLRVGEPPLLAGGWAEGTVGPIGSVRYALPAAPSYLRLDIPEPAPARLTVTRRGETLASDEIAKRSREPFAEVRPSSGGERVVEIAASEGQPFRLRALEPAVSRSISGNGPHWIAVDVAGEGADELPATALLARMDPKGGATVLASDLPRIGPGQAWRRRFNLRGASTILFEATGPMTVAVRAEGVGVRVAIEPLLGRNAPRADGKTRNRWDLEAGWYSLRLEPVNNAVGVLDLTLGPPGFVPELPKPAPERLTIPFGVHALAKEGNHSLLVNAAPGLVTATVARALPADVAAAPLVVAQKPGQPLELPVWLPARADVTAAEPSGAAVPFARVRETLEDNARVVTVRLSPGERHRMVVLRATDGVGSAEGLPRYERPVDLDLVTAGQPRFLDLARDERRSFALDVPEGGLYRVETLGRLKAGAALSTAFIPSLDRDEAGGPGGNALVQSYLRAGRYRVTVSASGSSGRLGLLARPARLAEGDRLLPEGSVRASLAGGAGVAFPIEIVEPGTYRLDLLGLGRTFTARIEDAEGWPLAKPGALSTVQQRFEAGRYRLVVLPEAVDARVVARLRPVRPAVAVEGHGPHALAFDSTRTHQWREPQGRDDPRVPDRWEFALHGPADVSIDIGDGMVGELARADESRQPVAGIVARIMVKSGFSGRLEAGRYAVEARSLGRNDRLDYALTLRAKELQPGRPRRVSLPAAIPFAVAEERVVSLTTFGAVDVRAVLRDADGRVIERVDDRADDWNVALSRRLPAGAYTLELSALPGAKGASGRGSSDESSSDQASSDESASGAGDAEPASSTSPGGFDGGAVEVALSLPADGEAQALRFEGTGRAEGPQVHRFSLAAPAPGSLLLAAAHGTGELVLALERQDPDGRWRTRGLDRGKAPLVAAPAEADGRPWRVSAWAVDGGPAAIGVAARAVTR
ncbi:MAG TPA: lysozyme inhibitor LprI family protein, partial [Beijerinckiaceae bacterium]